MDKKDNRRKIEAMIIKTVTTIDPTGLNAKQFQAWFDTATDVDFEKFIESIRSGETLLHIYAPNMTTPVSIDALLQAAHDVGLKLFERIKIFDSSTRRYYITPHEYLILQLPIRRLKQYLMDKISVPDSDRTTNPLTGQVAKPDKGSSISMTEAQTLDSKGLHKCLVELTNIRGGNQVAYANFRSALEETGEAHLSEIDVSDGIRSATVARVFLDAMHLENNL